jgi:hypothetical protein
MLILCPVTILLDPNGVGKSGLAQALTYQL